MRKKLCANSSRIRICHIQLQQKMLGTAKSDIPIEEDSNSGANYKNRG